MSLHVKISCCIGLILSSTEQLSAQKDGKKLYEGNNQYYSGKLPEASASYAKALEMNPGNRKANFNLGDALYKNGVLVKSGQLQIPAGSNLTPDSLSKLIFDQAAQNFAVVANSVSNKDTLHRAWHNIGNCYLQKKDYKQAADAYKKALRFDPGDEESRYNLAYALKHMPKEKQGGGGGSNQQQKQDKKDQKKQEQKNNMDKEQAEQMLKALMNAEKKLQDKRKHKEEGQKSSVDKDW